jgi:type IV secretion system protein TrbF
VSLHPFRRGSVRYGSTPSPATAFQRAAQAWDERLGSARVQAMNWRLAALCSIAVSVLLGAALAIMVTRSSVTPYVVEIDRVGELRAIGPAVEASRPTDTHIAHFLAEFIENIRSASIDPVVVRTNWLRAYDYVTDHGAQVLNAYARDADPFAKIGSTTVAVAVISVVRAPGDAFEVRWKEQTYENGAIVKSEHFTGVAAVVFKSPHTVAALKKNPLGLYVHAFNFSRDLIGEDRK